MKQVFVFLLALTWAVCLGLGLSGIVFLLVSAGSSGWGLAILGFVVLCLSGLFTWAMIAENNRREAKALQAQKEAEEKMKRWKEDRDANFESVVERNRAKLEGFKQGGIL